MATFKDAAKDPGIVGNLKISTPLLTRDATGKFTLTLVVEKSFDLKTFTPFPVILQGTAATETTFSNGKLQFQFTAPESATFYRVQTN